MDGQGLRNVFEAFDSTIQKIRQRERRIHQSEQDMNIGAPDIQVAKVTRFPFFVRRRARLAASHFFRLHPYLR